MIKIVARHVVQHSASGPISVYSKGNTLCYNTGQEIVLFLTLCRKGTGFYHDYCSKVEQVFKKFLTYNYISHKAIALTK